MMQKVAAAAVCRRHFEFWSHFRILEGVAIVESRHSLDIVGVNVAK